MSTEEEFEAIIQKALSEAADVRPATPAEYRAALLGWVDEIRITIEASEECDG